MRIADGAVASPGDLIVCTRNDHTVQAGEPGRTLANGDLLRIDAVTAGGLIVRRALDADPSTGQRRWTDRTFLYQHFGDAELGYAVTDHVAQSRTVTAGLAVIAGTEDRQHAYVALSRGTDTNMAYVFTVSPKLRRPSARPASGPGAGPLRPHHRANARDLPPAARAAETRDGLAVLAGVLDRDGQQLSASQTRQQALADADHLAILHAIWTARPPRPASSTTGTCSLAHLPPEHRREPGHQARWLWRTLRAAELAGLDPAQVLAAAIGERDLAGARDLAAVIDARIRYRTGALVPAPAGPWSAQVPAIADPERRAYLTEIAALMDARKDRIGEHAAQHALPWAVTALGPVPDDPQDRRTGRNGPPPSAPGGNYPATVTPRTRSAPSPSRPPRTCARPGMRPWPPSAPPTAPTCAACPTGRLLHLRDTYPIETAWAPQYVGDELRQVRAAAREARLAGLRASAEATAAAKSGDHDTAARQQELASQLPRPPRGLPAARDRLRHDHGRPRLTGTPPPAPSASWPSPPTPNSAAATPTSPSLRSARLNPNPRPTPSAPSSLPPPASRPGEMSQWINDLVAAHRTFAERLANLQSLTIPSQHPDYGDLGQAFPPWPRQAADAILQPPKPEIRPSPYVLERAADRDADWEAAD